ncbi:hypothetical protein ACHAXT_007005 [Thalassiosira profunda]
MKLSVASISLLLTGAAAFAPAAPSVVARGVASAASARPSALFAGPEEEEEGGLDLDLGEMFDMFDAADKGEDFDKAVADIKKEKED